MKSLLKKTQEIFSKKKNTKIFVNNIKLNKQKEQNKTNYNFNRFDKDRFFCCPKCKERILISLNPSNFSLNYNCDNDHEETNLDYNSFYQSKYINRESNRYCQQCKKEKLNINKIINCNICNMKVCGACVLKHKKIYKHDNFEIIYNNLIKKCPKHHLDISMFCNTCKENLCLFCVKKTEENEHFNHEMINFSDLIPGENEIKNNEKKLQQRINKNNKLINKLNNWKDEMCSLIDETIEKLNKDKLINQMIIQNFNWKYLDYINYKNYEMAIKKLEITNEGLENFYKSKMFIEQTNAITNYLFGKNHLKDEIDDNNNNINNIINEKEEKKEIEIKREKEKFEDIRIINETKFNIINNIKISKEEEEKENNVISALKNEKALLLNNNSIYSFSLENKNLMKIVEKDKKDNLNGVEIDKNIYKSIYELKNNLSNKLGNYNILIWKREDDLKKDGLINLIKNDKKKAINKFKNIQISNNNNFNILKQIKKIELDDNNEEKEKGGSSDNLLFSESISLFNSNSNRNNNNNSNNGLFNGLYNNNINNDITNLFTNYNSNNGYSNIDNRREIQREPEEYVYISRTGSKYHGRPTCGRMKSSSKVTISKAEALGLTPCMKCY